MNDYEKLGVFYLGQAVDPAHPAAGAPVLLESHRLTTHALCMGMTGSGKTGLCIALLEEAAIDGVPVLAIDPKGDLGNLLLTFPALSREELAPWVDAAEAERRGSSREELAEQVAQRMRTGLAESLQDADRIARLKAAADFAIYTPGSSAGLPLSLIRSLEAPAAALRDDEELLRERVSATVSGLLGLLDIDADPLQSREHILLSRILGDSFARGEGLSLAGLLGQVKAPPFSELGVLDLESFYPEKERMKLVLGLNNLLASPAFASWLKGEPLDVQSLLYTAQGKPRVSVISLAHLDDKQRMFVVTLLLNEVLAYTRAQSGTSSLRAIIYMDEVYGYFPPVAEPPSKRPMLTLLKQARAFGVGLVLATQNPVDLDYKGLSNIGTWFVGRLQTERDRARVLDGMEGAATTSGASFDKGSLDALLGSLQPRSFVMHSARGGAPLVFRTRQTLSFLRGPLTRAEIKLLMDPRKLPAAAVGVQPSAIATPITTEHRPAAPTAPVVPAGIATAFVPRTGESRAYAPALLAVFRHAAQTLSLVTPFEDAPLPLHFDHTMALSVAPERLLNAAEPGVSFLPVPAAALEKKRYPAWGKEALAAAIDKLAQRTWKSPGAKLESLPGENERDFRARVAQASRELRDERLEKLKSKYDAKLRALREKEGRLNDQLAREESQANSAKLEGVLDVGSAVLGALFGRSGVSRADIQRAGKVVKGAARISKEGGDVGRREAELAEASAQRTSIERELDDAVHALSVAPPDDVIEGRAIKPKKADVQVVLIALAFVPADLLAREPG